MFLSLIVDRSGQCFFMQLLTAPKGSRAANCKEVRLHLHVSSSSLLRSPHFHLHPSHFVHPISGPSQCYHYSYTTSISLFLSAVLCLSLISDSLISFILILPEFALSHCSRSPSRDCTLRVTLRYPNILSDSRQILLCYVCS